MITESNQDTNQVRPALVNEHEAAKYLSIPLSLLRRDRLGLRKIPTLKIGGAVRY